MPNERESYAVARQNFAASEARRKADPGPQTLAEEREAARQMGEAYQALIITSPPAIFASCLMRALLGFAQDAQDSELMRFYLAQLSDWHRAAKEAREGFLLGSALVLGGLREHADRNRPRIAALFRNRYGISQTVADSDVLCLHKEELREALQAWAQQMVDVRN
jgi:hypothetical protein